MMGGTTTAIGTSPLNTVCYVHAHTCGVGYSASGVLLASLLLQLLLLMLMLYGCASLLVLLLLLLLLLDFLSDVDARDIRPAPLNMPFSDCGLEHGLRGYFNQTM